MKPSSTSSAAGTSNSLLTTTMNKPPLSSSTIQTMTSNGLIPSSMLAGGNVVPPNLTSNIGLSLSGGSVPISSLKKQPVKILTGNSNNNSINQQPPIISNQQQHQQTSSEPSWRDEINREKRKELFAMASKIANITSEDNKAFLDKIVESWKKASSKEEFLSSISKLIFTNYKPASYTLENIQKELFDCINTKSNIGTSNIASNNNLQNNSTEDFTSIYWKVYEQLKKHADFIKTEVLTPLQKRLEESKSKIEKFPKGSTEYEKLSIDCTKQHENAKHLEFLLNLFNVPPEKRTSFKPNEGHMKFISSLKEGLKKKYKIQFDQDFDITKLPEKELQTGLEILTESLGFSYLKSTNSFVGDLNCFDLIPSTKKRDTKLNLPPNPKKRLSTIEIIKRSLINEVKLDELPSLTCNIVDPPLIKVEKQSETVYTVIFIVHPKEKGVITLPNLNIDVLVEDLNILPCSITFNNNYATEKNSLFVNIRRYFNNLIGGKALFSIGKSIDNVPFQNLHSSITLPQILNSWIQSIVHIIKHELM